MNIEPRKMNDYDGLRKVFSGAIEFAYTTIQDEVIKADTRQEAIECLSVFDCGVLWDECMSFEQKMSALADVYTNRETIELSEAHPELQAAALWLLVDFQTSICPWSSLDYSWFWGNHIEQVLEDDEQVFHVEHEDVTKYLDCLLEEGMEERSGAV